MNILLVSSYLPYPLFSGGNVRLYNIIKELSKVHTITLVCEKRDDQTSGDIEEVKRYCKALYFVPRKKQWTIHNIIKTGFSTKPFLLVGHTNEEMKQCIEELIAKEQFDLIHVETFYVMQNLPKEVSIPVVLVEHNVEYLVYERYTQNVPFGLRSLLSLDVTKLKIKEKKAWKQATKLIAVSEEEKQIMGRNDVVVVPNGVDVTKFQISPARKCYASVVAGGNFKYQMSNREKRILFIGDFKWMQNKDAVSWILKEICPRLESRIKNQESRIKLWIVGKHVPDSIKQLAVNDPAIIIDENASNNTSEIFQQASVLLAPIRIGGGTSFKILEAMASGVPVVTTPLGIEGIDAKDGKEVMVAVTPEEFVDKMVELLHDEKKKEIITKNARKLIETKYTWYNIVKILEQVYKDTINNSSYKVENNKNKISS